MIKRGDACRVSRQDGIYLRRDRDEAYLPTRGKWLPFGTIVTIIDSFLPVIRKHGHHRHRMGFTKADARVLAPTGEIGWIHHDRLSLLFTAQDDT